MEEIELQNLFRDMSELVYDSRQYLDEHFKRFDFTPIEVRILMMLRTKKDGHSQAWIKSFLGLEINHLTEALNKLEERGFIVREIDPNNGQNRIIKNPKAHDELKKIYDFIADSVESYLSDLNEKQLQELHNSLLTISKKIKMMRKHQQKL